MKLGTVMIDGRKTLVAKVGDGAAQLGALYQHAGPSAAPASLNDFIEAGKPERDRAAKALAGASGVALLEIVDRPIPVPGTGEVLLEVYAAQALMPLAV